MNNYEQLVEAFDNLQAELKAVQKNSGINFRMWEEAQAEVKRLKAQLPKRGEWVHGRELSREYIGDCLVSIDYEDWRCSVCGIVFEQWSIPKYNYCPNCGAKMTEAQA